MKLKVLVFDVDGTLAKTENPISFSVAESLKALENKVERIVLISGRTAPYLAGLARGMGLCRALVAGENGGVIFDPVFLGEKTMAVIHPALITEIRETLVKGFGEIWFQPNQTMLTAAPRDLNRIEELYQTVLGLKAVKENKFKINKYYDSVEVMPAENSKGRALAAIREILQVKREEVIVFGNTIVDLPMKEEAGEFYLISDSVESVGSGEYPKLEEVGNFPRIEDAFAYLNRVIMP